MHSCSKLWGKRETKIINPLRSNLINKPNIRTSCIEKMGWKCCVERNVYVHYPPSESSKIHSGLCLTGLPPAGAFTTIIAIISLCTQLINFLPINVKVFKAENIQYTKGNAAFWVNLLKHMNFVWNYWLLGDSTLAITVFPGLQAIQVLEYLS